MAVMQKYFNYQQAGTGHPLYNKGASPAMKELIEFLGHRWGMTNLGIFGVRNVRGGESLSTHAFGAAGDSRYMPSIPDLRLRAVCVNEIFPFLINNSAELNLQMIVDYYGGQIWVSDRTGEDWDARWKPAKASSTGMGQSWGGWLHLEVHPDGWHDGRSVEEKLGISGIPPEIVFNPAAGQYALWPLGTKPIIKQGASGDVVKYLQGVLRVELGYGIQVDGNFGSVTRNFVIWFQNTHGLTADGIVGPKTWAKIDQIAVQ